MKEESADKIEEQTSEDEKSIKEGIWGEESKEVGSMRCWSGCFIRFSLFCFFIFDGGIGSGRVSMLIINLTFLSQFLTSY